MQKRNILWWMMFFLLVCNTLVTLNINIAIVSMVNFHENEETEGTNETAVVCPNTTFFLRTFLNDEETTPVYTKNEGYEWIKEERSRVLSGYYRLTYLSILPGGILAQKYGSKIVVGYTQLISSLLSSLIPIFAGCGPNTVAWIRAVQGFFSFMSVPAGSATIFGRWSPPQERGTFGAALIIGTSMGQVLSNFCFGYIAEKFHWEYVFHMTSIFGIIWCVLWYLLVHDSPRDHPTITQEEKEYIESSLNENTSSDEPTKIPIPWLSILTSIPVVIGILALNTIIWAFVMIVTYTPIYLKTVYGLNSQEIGIIISVPQFFSCAISLLLGYFSDSLIKKNIFSLSAMRKIYTFIGTVIAGVPLIVIAFTNCNINVVIISILLYSLLKNFGFLGSALALYDISPRFCGILEGLCGFSSSVQTFLYSAMISYFTGVLVTEDLWKLTFTFTAILMASTNTLYILFGTTKVQPWNDNPSPVKS